MILFDKDYAAGPKKMSIFLGAFGELAQLGERLLCTQEVSGSIPLFSTTYITNVDDKKLNISSKKIEFIFGFL